MNLNTSGRKTQKRQEHIEMVRRTYSTQTGKGRKRIQEPENISKTRMSSEGKIILERNNMQSELLLLKLAIYTYCSRFKHNSDVSNLQSKLLRFEFHNFDFSNSQSTHIVMNLSTSCTFSEQFLHTL